MIAALRTFGIFRSLLSALVLPAVPMAMLLALWLWHHPNEASEIDYAKVLQIYGIVVLGLFLAMCSFKDEKK